MNKKNWTANWDDNSIVIENGWDWSGNCEEKVTINGEVIQSRSYDMTDVSVKRAVGTTFTMRFGEDNVTVVMGSAWYLFGTACRIMVNGKFVGGDRIVLFAKESLTK